MMISASLLKIDPRDDVAVAMRGLAAGDAVCDGVTAASDVPAGHKVALHPIAEGQAVLKYGWPIGRATRAIAAGEHVHTQNLATLLSGLETYEYRPARAEE